MRRFLALLVVGGVIVFGMLTSGSSDEIECETPVLAAGVSFATSCVETISYEGTTYYVDCVRIHPSREGELFVADGGDTYFDGARGIEGISRQDAFLLEGGSCPRGRALAASESFTRLQAGLLTVPLDTERPMAKARKRQPWIVPGKRQVPRALKLEAIVDHGTITITNRNRFVWRNCDQLQIASDDEWAPWEARPVTQLMPGGSISYAHDDFGRDSSGLEELSAEGAEDLPGSEVIIMCEAPKGRAFGATHLR